MKITKLVFTSLFIFTSSYSIADNCGFVKQIDSLVKLSPTKALKTNRFGDPAPFLSIGDGIGPSSPGIGEKDEAECVSHNYKFHMIWAGGDVSACDRQPEVVEKARKYAKKYNKLLRKNLTSDKQYMCTQDLLIKERERRCAETGHPLCTGLEDWEEAFFALDKFVMKLNSIPLQLVTYPNNTVSFGFLFVTSNIGKRLRKKLVGYFQNTVSRWMLRFTLSWQTSIPRFSSGKEKNWIMWFAPTKCPVQSSL